MLQAILVSPGEIELKEVPLPEPVDDEILIRVRTALTCGTDLKAFVRGHRLIPMPGPFGHEFSGTVVAAGRNVRSFKAGDDVMGVHSAPCLDCRYCRRGLHNLCERIMETKVLGAYSEYLLLTGDIVRQNLFPKPAGLTFSEASLLEPLSCVMHPYSGTGFEEIDNALIVGAGPIGLLHLIVLRSKGVSVAVMDVNRKRLDIAERMGAATSTPDKISNLIEAVTEGMGFDLIVECTGQVEVWESSIDLVRRGGRVILFGGCERGTFVRYPTHRLHYDEIILMGSFHFTPDDVKSAYRFMTENRVDFSELITDELPLTSIQRAFSLLQEGEGIKYAIVP